MGNLFLFPLLGFSQNKAPVHHNQSQHNQHFFFQTCTDAHNFPTSSTKPSTTPLLSRQPSLNHCHLHQHLHIVINNTNSSSPSTPTPKPWLLLTPAPPLPSTPCQRPQKILRSFSTITRGSGAAMDLLNPASDNLTYRQRAKNEEPVTRYSILLLQNYFPQSRWNFIPQYHTQNGMFPDLALENLVRVHGKTLFTPSGLCGVQVHHQPGSYRSAPGINHERARSLHEIARIYHRCPRYQVADLGLSLGQAVRR